MWDKTKTQRLDAALDIAARLRDGTSKIIDIFEALQQHHADDYAPEILRLRQRWKEEAQLVAKLEKDMAAGQQQG